jgi:hypothetical protein
VCLEIPDLFLVLNMIFHSFAELTREISCSTLEINLVFPRTHVYYSLFIHICRKFLEPLSILLTKYKTSVTPKIDNIFIFIYVLTHVDKHKSVIDLWSYTCFVY